MWEQKQIQDPEVRFSRFFTFYGAAGSTTVAKNSRHAESVLGLKSAETTVKYIGNVFIEIYISSGFGGAILKQGSNHYRECYHIPSYNILHIYIYIYTDVSPTADSNRCPHTQI